MHKPLGNHPRSGLAGSDTRPAFQEFFAGSGLVAHALKPFFRSTWANDVCRKKALVYQANHPAEPFSIGPIQAVRGKDVPWAPLAWASFPCQDLSLAGKTSGINAPRSGLVWEWLRVLDEMPRRPGLLVAENVVGLVSAGGGRNFRALHDALRVRRYRLGAVVLDAAMWVPQSRKRVFVIAVDEGKPIPSQVLASGPDWPHPHSLVSAAAGLDGFIWWRLPPPPLRTIRLEDLLDWDAPVDDEDVSQRNLRLVPLAHRKRLEGGGLRAAPGYRRIREGKQVLELRFDGVAGCLRTPVGGSSRQLLVIRHGRQWRTRLLTVREAARLMGAPESYQLPGGYNDGYRAMGDAVAVPVASFLAENLLVKLARSHASAS